MASKCASKTLFVGNLHASLEENDLLDIFRPFGRIVECCKRWCHYGFIQFATEDEARLAFNNLNGSKVRGRPMRIEFQRKKLRNIQALLEAEAEAKLHIQTGTNPLNSKLFSSSSFEHLNLLDSLSHHSSTSDLENINPLYFNLNSNASTTTPTTTNNITITNNNNNNNDFTSLFAPFGSLFKSMSPSANNNDSAASADLNTAEDEMLLFSNSMLLETCLLKVFDDLSTPLESTKPTNTIKSDVLKSISLNSMILLPKTPRKSSPDFNNNKQPKFTKTIQHTTTSTSNLDSYNFSSSCSSPVSQKDVSATTVPVFRSINTTNTIYIEPNDKLERLTEGDYPEYKLFPVVRNDEDGDENEEEEEENEHEPHQQRKENINEAESSEEGGLELYSPPLSSLSSVSSCSNTSSPLQSPQLLPKTPATLLLSRRHSPMSKFFIK